MHYISLNSIPEKPNKKHTNQQSEGNVINSPDIVGGGAGDNGHLEIWFCPYDFLGWYSPNWEEFRWSSG